MHAANANLNYECLGWDFFQSSMMVGKVKMAMIMIIPISKTYKGNMLFSFQKKVAGKKTYEQHCKTKKRQYPIKQSLRNELAEHKRAHGNIAGIEYFLRVNLTMMAVKPQHVYFIIQNEKQVKQLFACTTIVGIFDTNGQGFKQPNLLHL